MMAGEWLVFGNKVQPAVGPTAQQETEGSQAATHPQEMRLRPHIRPRLRPKAQVSSPAWSPVTSGRSPVAWQRVRVSKVPDGYCGVRCSILTMRPRHGAARDTVVDESARVRRACALGHTS